MLKPTSKPSVSFVIPAYNEEKHIEKTLKSILKNTQLNLSEIVVVDNESTDNTPVIATKLSAKVITIPGGPIAMLRNRGVLESTGDILIFLDADVSLSDSWHKNIHKTLSHLLSNPLTITGSHCDPPAARDNIFERYWFSSFKNSKSSHLGTGHMIMHRQLFEILGGFSEYISTGEDYDICRRAKQKGALVQENDQLVVHHNDFPKTALQFIKREAWHGEGDAATIKSTLHSKVGIITIVFLSLHIAIAASLTTFNFQVLVTNVATLIVLMVAISFVKFNGKSLKLILINSGIYYLYFIGRSLSLLRRWTMRSNSKKFSRSG